MSYQQATIAVTEHIAERLSDALMEHGALSAAIEDAYAGTNDEQAIFGEPGMPTEQLWLQSKVIALFAEEADMVAFEVHPCPGFPGMDVGWTQCQNRRRKSISGPVDIFYALR